MIAYNLPHFITTNLNVESLRDEYSSNSNGYNLNVGASSGGGKSAYIGYRIIKK